MLVVAQREWLSLDKMGDNPDLDKFPDLNETRRTLVWEISCNLEKNSVGNSNIPVIYSFIY